MSAPPLSKAAPDIPGLFVTDAREVWIDDAIRVIEAELHRLDAHQRIAIERALWTLTDRVEAMCHGW